MEAAIKSQDIPILLQILLHGNNWKYTHLEKDLQITVSALHRSVSRCIKAKLLAASKKNIHTGNLLNFIQYGIPYIFPATTGNIVRGVPTAYAAPVLQNKIIAGTSVVWPYAKGSVKGEGIEPLHKNIPAVALQNVELYNLLCLIDAIRLGKPREVEVASKLLTEKIKQYGQQFNQ